MARFQVGAVVVDVRIIAVRIIAVRMVAVRSIRVADRLVGQRGFIFILVVPAVGFGKLIGQAVADPWAAFTFRFAAGPVTRRSAASPAPTPSLRAPLVCPAAGRLARLAQLVVKIHSGLPCFVGKVRLQIVGFETVLVQKVRLFGQCVPGGPFGRPGVLRSFLFGPRLIRLAASSAAPAPSPPALALSPIGGAAPAPRGGTMPLSGLAAAIRAGRAAIVQIAVV